MPHTKLFGGVKRFFELGTVLISKGHQFVIFTPDGEIENWFGFKGSIEKISNIDRFLFDVLFVTEPRFLSNLGEVKATLKIFYVIIERSLFIKAARRNDNIVFVNSSRLYNILDGTTKQSIVKAIGGINLSKFRFIERGAVKEPDKPFTVIVYGRFYRKKKGTLLVVKACENLFKKGLNIKLILFDSPIDDLSRELVKKFSCKVPFEFFVDHPVDDLVSLYHKADVFVSAERNAGWSNTSAEAMASGTPVIATKSGTEDFLFHERTGLLVYRHQWFIQRAIKRLYNDEPLRNKIAINARKKIEELSWERLSETIERYCLSKIKLKA